MSFFESLGIVLGIVLVLILVAFAVASWLLPRRTMNYLETSFESMEARHDHTRHRIESVSDRVTKLEKIAYAREEVRG